MNNDVLFMLKMKMAQKYYSEFSPVIFLIYKHGK